MKSNRRSQAQRRHETRERVLGAASRVFARQGFDATSLDAVAEEAGFSRGAVYYNFADKEALFLELLDRRCAERAQDVRDAFAGDATDLEATGEQAPVAAQRALDALTADEEWRALFLEFLARAARDPSFRREFARRTAEMRAGLEEVVIERSSPVAEALPMSPAQLAATIDALGTGLWIHHMLHGPEAVPPELFGDTLSLLLEGIVARAESSSATGGSR